MTSIATDVPEKGVTTKKLVNKFPYRLRQTRPRSSPAGEEETRDACLQARISCVRIALIALRGNEYAVYRRYRACDHGIGAGRAAGADGSARSTECSSGGRWCNSVEASSHRGC